MISYAHKVVRSAHTDLKLVMRTRSLRLSAHMRTVDITVLRDKNAHCLPSLL